MNSQKSPSVWSTGLALFSMFFGAGNLIFPLIVGHAAGPNNGYAILGLSLTAVAFPLLGLAAMLLFHGNYQNFFGRLGIIPGAVLLFMLQAILGPVGVIPRLITLMHATLSPFMPGISLLTFTILTCGLLFFLAYRPQKMIKILGVWLTPLFLLALAILMIKGLIDPPAPNPVHEAATASFVQGLVGGYSTMDLITAFLFATVIFPYLQQGLSHVQEGDKKKALLKRLVKTSLIAAFLLGITYAGLSYLSSFHTWTLDGTYAPEELISAISIKLLGPYGALVAGVTVALACLTTAISLVCIVSDYVGTELLKERRGKAIPILTILLLTTFFANLGFKGIASFLGPISQVIYPGLILLSVLNIMYSLYNFKPVKTPVFLTFGVTTALYLVN